MSTTSQTQTTELGSKTSRWEFDPTHSSAEFAVRHLMISTVTGRFKQLKGAIDLDEDRIETSRVDAEINAASIDTGTPERDNHLRSADFFDVTTFLTIAFRSSRIDYPGGDEGRVHGEVTIHGVTRPVTLEVSYLGEITDPWGHRRRGFSAETTVYRKDFGMTWNQILDTGGVVVGDKINVTLNIEAVEKPAA